MIRFSKKLFFIFFTICFFSINSLCIYATTLKNNITLKVSTSADFPPFELMKNGKIIGIDPDILSAISKQTGINFIYEDMAFSSVIASIMTGKTQLAMSGITATEERRKNVDFTIPYYKTNCALITKKDRNLKKINLNSFANKSISTQTGTTMQLFLQNYNKTHQKNKQINIVAIDENAIGIETLINNKSDAFFTEELIAKAYTKMYDNLKITIIPCGNNGYSIALPKNSPHKKIINNTLIKLKKNGTLKKIINHWENKYIQDLLKEEKTKNYHQSLLFIVKGTLLTIQYAFISAIGGLTLALFLTLMIYSNKKILYFIAKMYISVIRGTPLLLQLSFVYFGLSHLLGVNLSVFVSGTIAFSINSSAYVAEIIRSGVRSIDKGQLDACRSLNLSKYQTIKDVLLPQVLHNIFPALINEFIALIKESSIISVLGGYEIMKRTNLVIAEYYAYFIPLIIAGICYYTLTATLEIFSHWWEKRYKY